MLEANTSPGEATEEMRDPTTTAKPPGLPSMISHSPVCRPARTSSPSSGTARHDRVGAPHRTRRPVETREEAVTGRVDLASAKADELLPDERVMSLNQIAPARVSQFRCALRGADDVGEEQRREDAIGLGWLPRSRLPRAGQKLSNGRKELALIDGPDDGVTGWHLDESCAGDPLGNVAARLDARWRRASSISARSPSPS